MTYPLVRDLAADGIPVAVACRVLGFSPQAFNKWRRNPVSQLQWDDAHLTNLARDIHHDDPTFGYRFVSDEISGQGMRASERRVWRICSQQGLWSLHAKKRGLTRRAGPPVHDDLVLRRFRADRPNQLWLTDITEHRTCRVRGAERDPAPRTGRRSPAFRSRVAISIEGLRSDAEDQRTDRVDGTGRSLRR
jgi:putative transposase